LGLHRLAAAENMMAAVPDTAHERELIQKETGLEKEFITRIYYLKTE